MLLAIVSIKEMIFPTPLGELAFSSFKISQQRINHSLNWFVPSHDIIV